MQTCTKQNWRVSLSPQTPNTLPVFIPRAWEGGGRATVPLRSGLGVLGRRQRHVRVAPKLVLERPRRETQTEGGREREEARSVRET
eukprot:2361595-Rhodomonas_salina.2